LIAYPTGAGALLQRHPAIFHVQTTECQDRFAAERETFWNKNWPRESTCNAPPTLGGTFVPTISRAPAATVNENLHNKPAKGGFHFEVYSDFFKDTSLTPMAKYLYLLLVALADHTTKIEVEGIAGRWVRLTSRHGSIKKIEKLIRSKQKKRRKLETELEHKGLLRIDREKIVRGNQKFLGTNIYLVKLP